MSTFWKYEKGAYKTDAHGLWISGKCLSKQIREYMSFTAAESSSKNYQINAVPWHFLALCHSLPQSEFKTRFSLSTHHTTDTKNPKPQNQPHQNLQPLFLCLCNTVLMKFFFQEVAQVFVNITWNLSCILSSLKCSKVCEKKTKHLQQVSECINSFIENIVIALHYIYSIFIVSRVTEF